MNTNGYLEFETEVEYTVYPGEPCVMWGDNAHPGCDAEIEINAVIWRGIDITEKLTDDEFQIIEKQCWEDLEAEKEQAAIARYEAMSA